MNVSKSYGVMAGGVRASWTSAKDASEDKHPQYGWDLVVPQHMYHPRLDRFKKSLVITPWGCFLALSRDLT